MTVPPRNTPASILTLGSVVLRLHERSHIMGILNVTPDSFSDGGQFLSTERAVEHGLRMADEGADIIDVGGESTRPRGNVYGTGASEVTPDEECARILPVIERLAKRTPVPISVDTWKSAVARPALQAGAVMVNDIGGFHFDPDMPSVVAEANAAAVLMHSPARPWEMPSSVQYHDLFGDIVAYLSEGLRLGREKGVRQMLIDPGFGFGKRHEDNLRLLEGLAQFRPLGVPVLVGVSRKSFIGKALGLPPEDRLEGSLAAAAVAILNGAHIVRVHDVAATRRAVAIVDELWKAR